MTETYALCRAQCSANDTELCDRAGPGRCSNGGYCCLNANDSFGFCAATQADCSRTRDQ